MKRADITARLTATKQAQASLLTSTEAGPLLARALAGGVIGAGTGRYVTPKIMGYEDDPRAVNMSTMLDATLGAIAGAGVVPNIKAWTAEPDRLAKLLAAVGAAELMPVGAHMVHKGTESAHELSQAARSIRIPPSIKDQIATALQTPEARGAGVGAAGAAGLGILSGLLRPKTRGELEGDVPRTSMVAKDALKFLIPLMLAGGLAGNVLKERREARD